MDIRITESRTLRQAYDAGYSRGLNGPTRDNCRFTFFSSPQMTAAWERGSADAEADREPERPD